MADITIKYTDKLVGAGHPSLADTLNRFMLQEHEVDGTHKLSIDISFVDIRGQLPDGYVSDGSIVYRTQIKAAADKAVANGIPLFIPPGIWNTDVVLRTTAEIFGVSGNDCVLYNSGIGDALDLGEASYHNQYSSFQVRGNPSSRDGITLYTTVGDNPAYMQFTDVYSIRNGRHGLNHSNAWGTKYSKCKFFENLGLGILMFGTTSAENAVSLIQCECRWNGGTSALTTFSDAKGGLSISGGVSVVVIGGVYESNNAWQILLGQDTTYSMSSIIFIGVYTEASTYPTVGGAFYLNYGSKIYIQGTTFGFSSVLGQTSYAYYIGGSMTGRVDEDNNYYLAGVAGTSLYINAGAKLNRTPVSVITRSMGDIGAGGSPVAQTLLTAANDGEYKIAGVIHCGRNSEQGDSFPFIATRYQSARSVTLGKALNGSKLGTLDTTKVVDTSYLAATDVMVYVYVTFTAGNTGVSAFTDAANPPTVEVQRLNGNGAYTVAGSISFVCRKGDYYKVASIGIPGSVTIKVMPMEVINITTIPTIAWSGNNLQVTWGAYHVGYVEFSYSYASLPSQFSLNSTYLQRSDELANLPF